MSNIKALLFTSLLSTTLLWNTDSSASTLYGALYQDKATIDYCYFDGQLTPPHVTRSWEDCTHTEDLYVDDANIIHHKFKCDVIYTPNNPDKLPFKRSYYGEYQAKPFKERLITRVILTDVSKVFEFPDPNCDLTKWIFLTKD